MQKKIIILVVLCLMQASFGFGKKDKKEEAKNKAVLELKASQTKKADYDRKDLLPNPTALDSMLKDKENTIGKVDPAKRNADGEFEHLVGKGVSSKEGIYALQFEAVADFDAAQKRRWQLSSRTGYNIYLVFNAPFYKLRSGSFTSKAKAEEAVASLAAANVTAFIVKVK